MKRFFVSCALALVALTASMAATAQTAAEPRSTAASNPAEPDGIYYCEKKLGPPPPCYKINSDGAQVQTPFSILPAAIQALVMAPSLSGPNDARKIIRCYTGYDPVYCVEIPIEHAGGGAASLANSVARSLADNYKARTLAGVSEADRPVTQCGNGHGQSACCKIIAENPITGTIYIECGVPLKPVQGPIAHSTLKSLGFAPPGQLPAWFDPNNPATQCGNGHGQTACCRRVFCLPGSGPSCEEGIVCGPP